MAETMILPSNPASMLLLRLYRGAFEMPRAEFERRGVTKLPNPLKKRSFRTKQSHVVPCSEVFREN